MKNLFVVISDIHISLKNLSVSLQVLRQALEKARELNVPLIIAGDLNDTKAIMRSEWVQALIDLFNEFGSVEVHIINGNHDLNNKAGKTSSLAFLHLIDNVYVYNDPTGLDFGKTRFVLIPYCNHKEEFLFALEDAQRLSIKNVICHQGFKGAFMGDYAVDESSVDPEELKDFNLVLSGHYHRHQWVGENIMYFGSPFTVNFGEAGHEKFIWVISEHGDKLSYQPILTNVRKHVQFTFENEIDTTAKYLSQDDLVKIILKGTKEFALKDHSQLLSKLFPTQSLTIIPDIVRQSEERISQEIVHKPIQVIEQYLETADTQFNKEELKNHLWNIVADILNNLSNKINKDYKITEIIAQNFLSFEELKYQFDAKGLTLIEGHDEDYNISTGAGKSSFLDTVCYGIFGETSKKLKADEVINRKFKKDLEVHIGIQGPEGFFSISRYRNHRSFENDLFINMNDQAIRGKDSRETQKMIEDMLGMDFDMFIRSTYFTQFGEIDKFLSASDTEKKKIISEICDTKVYDEMTEAVKAHIKDFKFRATKVEQAHIAKTAQYDVVHGNVAEYRDKSDDFKQAKFSKLEKLHQCSINWEADHSNKMTELVEKCGSFDRDKERRLSEEQKRLEEWDVQERLEEERIKHEISNKTEQLNEILDKTLAPEAPSFDTEKEQIAAKFLLIKNLEIEITKFDGEIHAKTLHIESLNKEIQQAQLKESDVNCHFCFQPISKDHIDKHIKEIKLKIDYAEREIEVIRIKRSKIVESVSVKSQLESRQKEIAAKEYEYTILLKNTEQYKNMSINIQKDIDLLKDQLRLGKINPHQLSLNSIQNELNPYEDQIRTISAQTNPYLDQIKDTEESTDPYIEMFHDAAEKLSFLGSELESLSSELQETNQAIEYSNWWKDALHIYIKSYLTDSFLEQVNTLANQKLSQMFDSILSLHISATSDTKKGSKEKINVTIYNKNDECSYHSLSGGERCRICFALNLAIAEITNINMGFLMFDEILNGLDDVGKSQVMTVLKELESKYGSVFVIDHTTEFKSLFTNNIMITKSNGISSIVE